jgi:hypothetical protein
MHGIDKVAAIKMDAEGMELEILEGAPETLSRTQEIAMETHGRDKHDAVMQLLKRRGFSIVAESFAGSTGLVFGSRTGQQAHERELFGSRQAKP